MVKRLILDEPISVIHHRSMSEEERAIERERISPRPRNEYLEYELDRTELLDLANREAKEILGVSSVEEAFRKLDAGELHGTIAEAEFSMLREMLK